MPPPVQARHHTKQLPPLITIDCWIIVRLPSLARSVGHLIQHQRLLQRKQRQPVQCMYPHIPRVVAPPPPDVDSTHGSDPDLKIRIALGFVGGTLMLVLMLVLCCWIKHPPPRVSTTNDYRSFMGHAMPPIPRKKEANALLSIEALDKHFPVQTYDAAMGSDQQGVSNANGCNRRPARDDGKAVPSIAITS